MAETEGYRMISATHALHEKTTVRWHGFAAAVEIWLSEFSRLVAENHRFNFRLWHKEDEARAPNASDGTLADVKRTIDSLNQRRNDSIEELDHYFETRVLSKQLGDIGNRPLNTETPGSAIDRLSILALRIYHMKEELARAWFKSGHDASRYAMLVDKVEVCEVQCTELLTSTCQLLDDILTGRKRHKVYRQNKMYNDPTLNPAIYNAEEATDQQTDEAAEAAGGDGAAGGPT